MDGLEPCDPWVDTDPYLMRFGPCQDPQATVVLLHGWPTSHLLFHRLVPRLVSQELTVVVLDLPGHGVSSALPSSQVGAMARAVLDQVVTAATGPLLIHGQDWGSVVAAECGRLAPGAVAGVHVSAGLIGFMGALPPTLPSGMRARLGAYLTQQSLMPEPLQLALVDCPVANFAWQLDKYRLWRPDLTRAEDVLGIDFLYGNATLAALARSAGTALQIFPDNRTYTPGPASSVPTSVSVFAHCDFADAKVAARHNHLVAFTHHPTGGHLAALEEPDLLATDITSLVRTITEHPPRKASI
ncbi:alpha/beta fold hydrolase [Ornithinimicrobium panacihumi]